MTSKKVDNSKLKRGNRWTTVPLVREGGEGLKYVQENNFLEVQLRDNLGLDDQYKRFDIGVEGQCLLFLLGLLSGW